MITSQRTIIEAALSTLRDGPEDSELAMLAMHLSEIEDESGAILDLVAALRSAGRGADGAAVEDVLGALVIALEYAQSHIAAAVTDLQQRLDLAP